ncbi:hypothetical protein BDZ94DRAFT_1166034 [Collybia nuda]|uniref:Uncharacterized protein n=1 Tax=Collybia nuda TaxID=64659 RepID=A0A9P5Y644_9AGAR|nr:hypothetical protein BDZ94DRAFT_1166034 [Collybia nuda]
MAHNNIERRAWPGGTVAPHDFPTDVQRLIFEIAARRDGRCALQLVLVARHVRSWIDPILYECIIVRTQHEASALLETMCTKPPGFFDGPVRALAFGSTITFQQAKPILATSSSHITDFAVWGESRNPSVFLPFVRSTTLRRLSLRAQNAAELNIPPAVLSELTHLVVLGGPYSWYHLRNAIHIVKACASVGDAGASASAPVTGPTAPTAAPASDTAAATRMFQSLTHFGVCSQNWGSTQAILKVAKHLKYFAVLVPPHYKAAPTIRQRIAELGDRRVVLVEYEQTVGSWEVDVRGGASVWDKVERLVGEGRFSERAEDTWGELGEGGLKVAVHVAAGEKPRTGLRSGTFESLFFFGVACGVCVESLV